MISVSFLKSKLSTIDTLNIIDESNADFIHVDLIDGIYCGENNFEINNIINILSNRKKKLDIHLMIKNPNNYIKELVKLNPFIITIHIDACDNILETIKLIKDNNIKVGIAINPNDDINIINDYINMIDYVLIMSVFPGRGGQSFIPSVIDKIDYLKDKELLIGIDGGINEESIKYLNNKKIDIIVSGSFICMSDDYNKQIDILKSNNLC